MVEPLREADLIKRGKAREFWIYRDNQPTSRQLGLGFQDYARDNWSILDVGTFPQQIPSKAENNYRTGVNFFNLLEKAGIPHHMTRDLGNRKMEVRAARIPPDYDWIKRGETVCYLVPMEVIFSKWVTPVSSLHKRLRKGEEDPSKYGLEKPPEKNEFIVLEKPKITHSTKIEAIDKYQHELKVPIPELAGLVGDEPQRVDEITLAVYNEIIRDAEDIGLLIEADGKLEFIMGPEREFYVSDTGYSWDEDRKLYIFPDGSFVDVSKQFPRNIYTINGFRGELEEAKEKYPEDKSKWPKPPLLTDKQIQLLVDANDAVRMVTLREKGAEKAIKDVAYRARDELNRLKELYKRDETGEPI